MFWKIFVENILKELYVEELPLVLFTNGAFLVTVFEL